MLSAPIVALDIGNSQTKIGIIKQGSILQHLTLPTSTSTDLLPQKLKELILYLEGQAIIIVISNVGLSTRQLTLLQENLQQQLAIEGKSLNIQILDGKVSGILENNYLTPQALGSDRWAAINAAAIKYPNQSLIVISLGTALTLDFANPKKQYLGGIIAPGLNMRYQALHDYTQKLPLLNPPSSPLPTIIGNTTESAMHIGVIKGLQGEIEYFVNEFCQKSEQKPVVIFSGGSVCQIPISLKNIYYEPHLVLEGIYYLYHINATKHKT
ncbi:MAG: type III pantothenate kinase [Bacteroidia bacterium]|nr:type III pantothenate kinase [Bacteroidia bacterium]MDW8158766.1 type III pantothenate kinase [Bacteroidia bacterium]